MTDALYQSDIHSLPLLHRGKVRDIYAVGADHLLIVTTDRLSAFDVIMSEPIPGKGAVLTGGGWKVHEHRRMPETEFRKEL